jgi:deoxycytidylate deaminase
MSFNINHACKAAHAASTSEGKFRVGAVLVSGRYIIKLGRNSDRTHPRMQRFNPDRSYTTTMHAEVDACMGVPDEVLEGAEIYVVRLTRTDKWALARPCEICQKFLTDAGIRKVYYSNEVGEMELWNT